MHQAYEGLRKDVRLLATPSTCAQFVPHADEFAVDRRPPAYRTLELQSDGSLLTEVVWVEKRIAGLAPRARSPRQLKCQRWKPGMGYPRDHNTVYLAGSVHLAEG